MMKKKNNPDFQAFDVKYFNEKDAIDSKYLPMI